MLPKDDATVTMKFLYALSGACGLRSGVPTFLAPLDSNEVTEYPMLL